MIVQEPKSQVAERALLQSIERVVPSGISLRGPLASLLLHCAIALACVSMAPWIPLVTHRVPEPALFDPTKSEITIYYFRYDLPEISDRSGAQSGKSGPSGGGEYFHPRQAIRIAHGLAAVPAVVDAPKLDLPTVKAPANLLVLPGPLPIAPTSTVTRSAISMHELPAVVVPPPPASTTPLLTTQEPTPEPAVPPPSETLSAVADPRLEMPVTEVVAPPPVISGLNRQMPSLIVSDYAVLPPAPAVASEDAISRSQTVATAAPVAGSKDVALIIAANPGHQVGSGAGVSGALVMSPAGSTGGAGGKGNEPGQNTVTGILAMATGSGSGNVGDGPGSDSSAHGGISPGHGAGGAGSGDSRAPTLAAGVMISNGQYYVPSFAAAPGPAPRGKAQSWATARLPSMVVVATPNSGTALVSSLRGRRIYTLYLDTTVGSVVFQFADNTPQGRGFERDLTAPAPIVTNFPPDLRVAGTTINCILDKTGKLRNLTLDRTSSPDRIPKIFEVLRTWLFRPALKGEEPIEVIAAIGIGGSKH